MLQPCFECIAVAAIEECYRGMRCFIHNDGAVGVPLFEGEVVDSDCCTAHWFRLCLISPQKQADDTVAAGFDTHCAADSRAALAVCLQCKHADEVLEPSGHTAIMADKAVDGFRYGCGCAGWVFAQVFVCANLQLDVLAEDGQILHAAESCAVVVLTHAAAGWALAGVGMRF